MACKWKLIQKETLSRTEQNLSDGNRQFNCEIPNGPRGQHYIETIAIVLNVLISIIYRKNMNNY